MSKEYIERNSILQNLPDDVPYKASVKRVLMQSPVADVAEVVHGKWEMNLCDEDDYEHHRCSICKSLALFAYENETIWDENSDGDMVECGEFTSGINEYLTPYCPNCGAKMDGERKEV